MSETREEIMGDVLNRLQQLADDWEYSDDIRPESLLLADLGLESLDLVILGTAIQTDYGQALPFMELFADMGQREVPDVSVREWVDFIYEHLNSASGKAAR